MKSTVFILSGFYFMFLVVGCKKPIPPHVITTVKGVVIDTVKNKRLSNATVIINGCHQANFRTYCIDSLASTKTDANGAFQITFKADGRAIGFEATVRVDENFDYPISQPLEAGKTNNISLKAREKNYLKAHIKVTNNVFDTLVALSIGTKHLIYGRSPDTTLYFRVLPNAQNFMIFSAWDKGMGGYRRLIDTLQITLQDTTIYNRILPDVQDFTLH